MEYHSKYTGAEVDALLGKVESGDVGGKVTVDSALSTESENPVMNKVITEELGKKLEGEVVGTTSPTEGTVGGSYDDTELRNAITDLQEKDAQTDEKLTELSAEMPYLNGGTIASDVDLVAIATEHKGKYVDKDGAIIAYEGYDIAAIPCGSNVSLKIRTRVTDSSIYIYAYDRDLRPIASLGQGPILSEYIEVVTPVNTAFIYVPYLPIYKNIVSILATSNGAAYSPLVGESFADTIAKTIGYAPMQEIDFSEVNDGYIGANSGGIYADTYYAHSNAIRVTKGQYIFFTARVATSVAALSLTDEKLTTITPLIKGDGSSKPTLYTYLVENDGYIVVSFYKTQTHTMYIATSAFYTELLAAKRSIERVEEKVAAFGGSLIEDGLMGTQESAVKQGIQVTSGSYGKSGAKYKVAAEKVGCHNGICHIAFDFKINEDVNKGNIVNKTFFRIQKDDWYADFILQCGATSVFEGKEAKASHSLTTTRSGMPFFNSKFGTQSNWSTPGDRLNLFMDNRSFRYDDNNKSHCYKPLCGKDLFSIQLRAVDADGNEIEDTLGTTAQAIYGSWQDAYIEVNDTGVAIVSPTNAVNYMFAFADYGTMTELFAAIYNQLHGTISNGVKWIVTDINTSYYTQNASDLSKIVRCKIYLASEHPSSGNTSFYDAFPCYVPYALDESWHTFELLSRADQDTMYFCIDGQYYGTADSRNWDISNIRYILKNADFILGGDLDVTYRNLLIEANEYQKAEVGKGVHYIISERNPYILCLFLHEMYYAPNVGGDFSSYMTFESGGGKIPDSLKNPNANYVGDDYIQESRKTVTFPSWSIEDVISRLHDKGYMCISKKDLPKVMSGEICNPKNRYYIMDIDDHQTYIYDREDCRNIFTRYNCRPCFANELGFYLTKEISDELAGYDVANFIESYCKDTNEHRLALQKRLQSLLHSGWTLDIHGSKEGYTFQGKTYQQMKAEILNAINISKFYGLPINAWCYAANYYTPNAVKLLKSMGIEYGTSTASQPIGKCRDNGFLPRIMITTNVANNIKVII